MAVRRGIWLVIGFILIAVAFSVAGLVVTAFLVGRPPQVPSNSTLVLRLGGDLRETEPGGLLGAFTEAPPTVRSVVDALRKAKVDRRVSSVVIRPAGNAALWAKVQEVRDAILDFKTSDKPIVAFLEGGGDQEFYLASACDRVFLVPTGSVDLTGLASYELFLRGTLDKVGAYPDVLHIGEYKTAANTFSEYTFTPEHREMAESLNRDLYMQLVRGIAEGRQKTEAEVRALIDHGPFHAAEAVRAGLVDELAYEDELDDKVDLAPGDVRWLEFRDYRVSPTSLGLNRGPRIAVLYAVGVIASGESRSDGSQQVVGSDTILRYLRTARADNSVRAIVLRIDSPGGSAVASDVIWREVELTRQIKPVIASMSDVAASGGYYIAMAATRIVAQPATLTGSIGVVSMKFVIDGTLKNLGINVEAVADGQHATMYSPVRPFTPEERRKLTAQMQVIYDAFVEKAAAGRNATPQQIDALARGRVWTGLQAKENGLVDELGGLQQALRVARQEAGIDPGAEVELVIYPPRRTFFDRLQTPFGALDGTAVLSAWLGLREERTFQAVTAPLRLFRRGEPLAIMPNVFGR